jgi:hypothetical protein
MIYGICRFSHLLSRVLLLQIHLPYFNLYSVGSYSLWGFYHSARRHVTEDKYCTLWRPLSPTYIGTYKYVCIFNLLFSMAVRLGLLQQEDNVDWRSLRTECWEEISNLRSKKKMKARDNINTGLHNLLFFITVRNLKEYEISGGHAVA